MPITVGHSKSVTVADGTNTGIVRPSDWNSNHAVTLNISGTDIFGAFSNAGNVTFGTDLGGYITATAPAGGGGGIALGAGGNTATSGTVTFGSSAGNVTFGMNPAGYVTASAPSGGGGGAAISAGANSQSTGTVIFSNSNGLTFGLNAGTLTASHNGLTTARASNDGIGLGTALTAGPLAWTINSGGLSLNAGSAAGTTTGFGGNLISATMTHNTAGLNLSLNHPAWLTTAANSTHSHGNPTLNLTNLSGTTASASNGLTISLSAAAPLAATVFSNSNNVSFGLAGSTITATATFPSGTDTWYATGANTIAGTNTSGTFANDNYILSGAGIASIGISNNTVVISVPSGGGAGDGFNEAQFTNSTANSTQAIVWAGNSNGSGNVTMGLTGSTVTMSAAGGAADLTKDLVVLQAEMSNDIHWNASSNWSGAQNSIYFMPFQLDDYLSAGVARLPVSLSYATSAVSSGQKGLTISMALYSRTASNATRLTLHYSTSHTMAASYSSNVSMAYSVITDVQNSTSYGSVSSSSAGVNLTASIHGPRELLFPISSLLSSGSWWLAIAQSSSTAGTAGNILNLSVAGRTHQPFFPMHTASNGSNTAQWQRFAAFGVYSTTSGGFPNSVNFTQINANGLSPILCIASNKT